MTELKTFYFFYSFFLIWPLHLLFLTSHINMLCDKARQDFGFFTHKSTSYYSINYSANQASHFLEVGLEKPINTNKFYYSLKPSFLQGTTQKALIGSAHRQFINLVRESIIFTIDRGGYVD